MKCHTWPVTRINEYSEATDSGDESVVSHQSFVCFFLSMDKVLKGKQNEISEAKNRICR